MVKVKEKDSSGYFTEKELSTSTDAEALVLAIQELIMKLEEIKRRLR